MEFWHTQRLVYLFAILVFTLPYVITIQIVESIDSVSYNVILLAPLWQYIISTPDYTHFAVSPFGLIYIIWYWPSVYLVKLVNDVVTKDTHTRWQYMRTIVFLIVLQVFMGLLLPVSSGYPPVTNIPLVLPMIIALILTRWIVRVNTEVWEPESESVESPFSDF